MTDPTKNKETIANSKDMITRYNFLKAGKLLEAQRIKQKVTYDLEMIQELGYVKGVENYSRYFDGRSRKPHIHYLIILTSHLVKSGWCVDESHMTFPKSEECMQSFSESRFN